MNYYNLKQSQGWIANMNQSYIDSLGPTVLIFKLNKKDTRINPIYNEEVNGRNYLRPFEIKAIHEVGQFDFLFDNGLASENEAVKYFNFNFNKMVRTIHKLKKSPISQFTITPPESSSKFFIKKENDRVYLTKTDKDSEDGSYVKVYNLNEVDTVSELLSLIREEGIVCELVDGIDDLSACIPDFKEIEFTGSSVRLSTFNQEYDNATDIIDNGDLIYIQDTNRLYEVNSATPAGNMGWKYTMWTVKCSLTNPYVNRNELKKYKYGLGAFNV